MKELDSAVLIDSAILEEVQKASVDGRLACGKAEQLAEKLGVSRLVIGQAASQLKIKIKQCQLGCF